MIGPSDNGGGIETGNDSYAMIRYQCGECGYAEEVWNSTAAPKVADVIPCRSSTCSCAAVRLTKWKTAVPTFSPLLGSRIFVPISREDLEEWARQQLRERVGEIEWLAKQKEVVARGIVLDSASADEKNDAVEKLWAKGQIESFGEHPTAPIIVTDDVRAVLLRHMSVERIAAETKQARRR